MKIFQLSINIDGFGGKLEDQYFYKFEDAKKALSNAAGFFYDPVKKLWDIEHVRGVQQYEDEDSIYLKGIPYMEHDKNEFSIRWAEAKVTPIELDGEPTNDKIHVLVKKYGYNTYIDETRSIGDNEMDPIWRRTKELKMSFSKNYLKKMARTKFKIFPREWNRKEYEFHCSVINGGGEDYISLLTYQIV